MANYRFKYFRGQSTPSDGVTAETDKEAVQKIQAFLRATPDVKLGSRNLVPGSIKATRTETWDVPDPPELIQPKQKERYRVEL